VTVLAHAGHWLQSLLYVAPVVIVVVGLWIVERRDRRRDEATRPPPGA
jgi:cytochrome c-type biogenesis protein CcmH/NrfF